MSHTLSTRHRPWPRYPPKSNYRYSKELGVLAAAMMDAARICQEAGATPEQATEAAQGNPVLDGLAEVMERQQTGMKAADGTRVGLEVTT